MAQKKVKASPGIRRDTPTAATAEARQRMVAAEEIRIMPAAVAARMLPTARPGPVKASWNSVLLGMLGGLPGNSMTVT
jgi:hypothetical protein